MSRTAQEQAELERVTAGAWAHILRQCPGLNDTLVERLWKADFASTILARMAAEREGAALLSIAMRPFHGGRLLRGRDLMGWTLHLPDDDNRCGEEVGAVMWSRVEKAWTARCGDCIEQVVSEVK